MYLGGLIMTKIYLVCALFSPIFYIFCFNAIEVTVHEDIQVSDFFIISLSLFLSLIHL